MFKKISAVCVLMTIFGAFGFAAEAVKLETVITVVDGQAVTKDDVYTAFLQFYPDQANETLNRVVNNIVVKNEAARQNVIVTDKEVQDKARDMGLAVIQPAIKDTIEASLLLDKLLIKEKKLLVSDKEVKEFYKSNKDKISEPELVQLKQILVKSEAQANEILLAIKAGADFSKMAEMKSEEPLSAKKKGDVGTFKRGMLVPEIEQIVFSLKPGEVSPVMKTQSGFVILQAVEHSPAKIPKYDSILKKKVKDMLLSGKIQKEATDYMQMLRKKAITK